MITRPMAAAEATSSLEVHEPIDGAVLHRRIGREVPGGLEIDVCGKAQSGVPVFVQGRPAYRDGERFSGTAVLKDCENEIVVTASGQGDHAVTQIRVVWDRYSQKRYRFGIDDNIFFLRDVAQKGYRSLFDCFYLDKLRDLHTKYGTSFILNLYYTTGDGWDLHQFPDRYRNEWKDNAHWLRLAFHAYADQPADAYLDVPVEKLLADVDLVAAEVDRFAGADSYFPSTWIHWGTRQNAWKPLYDHGSRGLCGYFRKSNRKMEKWLVSYGMDDARAEWLSCHDLLKDYASGIMFSRLDLVVNSTPLDKIVPALESIVADPCQGEILELLTHEQYFWPFYQYYLPDHWQRMERAIEFVTGQGYKPTMSLERFL
ncbi:MAG: hypothetical protein PHR77_07220 [Kiritimatiellae bacterium]|nr:hypothetical protein [Kiritimatiellia bacterium]MDD5519271.1 hypothetical protein [Kiritimatiellia bacterium]